MIGRDFARTAKLDPAQAHAVDLGDDVLGLVDHAERADNRARADPGQPHVAPGYAPAAIKPDALGLARHAHRLGAANLVGQRRERHLQAGVEHRRVDAILAEFALDGGGRGDPPQRFAVAGPGLGDALERRPVSEAVVGEAAIELGAVDAPAHPLPDRGERARRG